MEYPHSIYLIKKILPKQSKKLEYVSLIYLFFYGRRQNEKGSGGSGSSISHGKLIFCIKIKFSSITWNYLEKGNLYSTSVSPVAQDLKNIHYFYAFNKNRRRIQCSVKHLR